MAAVIRANGIVMTTFIRLTDELDQGLSDQLARGHLRLTLLQLVRRSPLAL